MPPQNSMRLEGSRRGTYPMLNLTGTKHLHRIFDAHFVVEQQKFVCGEKRALASSEPNTLPALIGLSTLKSAVAMSDAEYLGASGGTGLLSHLALGCSLNTQNAQGASPQSPKAAAAQLYSMTMMNLFNEKLLRRSGDRGDVVAVAQSTGEAFGVPLHRDWQRLRRELLVGGVDHDGGRGSVWFGQQLINPTTGRYHYVIRNRWPAGTCPASYWDPALSPLPPQFHPFFPAPGEDGPEGTLQPSILSAAQEDVNSLSQLFLADESNELQYLISSNDDKRRRLVRLVGSLPPVLLTELAEDIGGCERELHFRDQLVRLLTLLFRRFMVPATTKHWSTLLNGYLLTNSDPSSQMGRVMDVEDAEFLLGFILERVSQMQGVASVEHQEELFQVASDLQELYPSARRPTLFAPCLVPSKNKPRGRGANAFASPPPATTPWDTHDAVRKMITKNAAQLEALPPNMQLKRVAELVKGHAVEERVREARYGLINASRVLLRSILGLYAPGPSATAHHLHWTQRNLLLLACYHTVRCSYHSWPSVSYLHRFSVTLEQLPNTKLTTAEEVSSTLPAVKESSDGKANKDRLNNFIEALVLASGYTTGTSSPPGTGTTRSPAKAPARIACSPVASYFHYVVKTDFTTVEALTAWGVCTGAVDPPKLSPLSLTSLFPDGAVSSPPPSYTGVLTTLQEWVSQLPKGEPSREASEIVTPLPPVRPSSSTMSPGSPQQAALLPKSASGKRQVGKKEEGADSLTDASTSQYPLRGPTSQNPALSRDVCDPFRSIPEWSHESALLQLIDVLLGHTQLPPADVDASPPAGPPPLPKGRGKGEAPLKDASISDQAPGAGLALPRPPTAATDGSSPSMSATTIPADCLLHRPFTAPIVSSLTAVLEVTGHTSFNSESRSARAGEVPPPLYGLVGPLVQVVCGASSNPILPPRRRHVLSSRLQGSTDTGLSSKTGYWLACELLAHPAHFSVTPPPFNGEVPPSSTLSLLRMLHSVQTSLVVVPAPFAAGCPLVGMQGELVGLTSANPPTSRVESIPCLLRFLSAVANSGEPELAVALLKGLTASPAEHPKTDALPALYHTSRLNGRPPTIEKHHPKAGDRLRRLGGCLSAVCDEWDHEDAFAPNGPLLGLFVPDIEDAGEASLHAGGALPEAVLAASPPHLRGLLSGVLTPLAAFQQGLVEAAVEEVEMQESSGQSSPPSNPSSPTTQAPMKMPTSASPAPQPASPAALLNSELSTMIATEQARLLNCLLRARTPPPTAREVVARSIVHAVSVHTNEASHSLKLLQTSPMGDAKAQSDLLASLAGHINTALMTVQLYWRMAAMEVLVGTSLRLGHCYVNNQY